MSFRHSIIFIALLSGILYREILLAQPAPDTIHLPEVKIFHKENFPGQLFSYSELDSSILNQNLNASLSDILSKNSTIYIKSTGRGTLSTVSIRGTNASHTKICWNGLAINSPMLGQTDLSLIPAIFLDNVSLYHGGTSLIISPGGLGGVVALDNKPAWNNKNSFSLTNEIASFGTYQIFGKIELKKNNWISKSRAFYSYSENDYPFYNRSVIPSEKQRLQNSQFTLYGYLHEFYFRTQSDDLFSAMLWIQRAARHLPQPVSREGSEIDEKQSDGNIRSVFSWKHYEKNTDLELSSGIISDKINYTLSQTSDGNTTIDSYSQVNSFINRGDYYIKIDQKTGVKFQVLYNYHKAGISEKISIQGYNAKRSELSMMAGINREFGRNLNTWILLRSVLNDKDFTPLMPSVGLSVKILNSKEFYLRTSLSRNYNTPTLNDMYWIPGGNPDLRPEESYTADIGLEYKWKNNIFMAAPGITGYISRISDWIIWRPTEYQYWSPQNIEEVLSRGLEFSIKTTAEISNAKIYFNGTYNLCRTTDSGNRQLIYIPVHNFNSRIGLNYRGYEFECQAGYTGTRYTQTEGEGDGTEIMLEPYLITDLSFGKELSMQKFRMNLNFRIYNIFNQEYQVILSRPMPGRNYSLIFGISF